MTRSGRRIMLRPNPDVVLVAELGRGMGQWCASTPGTIGSFYQYMARRNQYGPISPHRTERVIKIEAWLREPARVTDRDRIQRAAHKLCAIRGNYPDGGAPVGAPMIWSIKPTGVDA
jgi:hypothetical protein